MPVLNCRYTSNVSVALIPILVVAKALALAVAVERDNMIGLLGATMTIAATTIDDAIWLVPYVTAGSRTIRWIHMGTFVGTLVGLAIVCVVTSSVMAKVIPSKETWILGAIGAGLCWAIAIGLWIKQWLKKKKRRAEIQEEQQQIQLEHPLGGTEGYGAVAGKEEEGTLQIQEQEEQVLVIPIEASPWIVASLTCLGAMDEISYFPALLVSHIFTGWEMVLGSFLAAILILTIITTFLATCQPLIQCLDQIPLYYIVGMFAIILSVGVSEDILKERADAMEVI